jgi:3-polyprenyl-4-hydroxybenzoate decarboxylase
MNIDRRKRIVVGVSGAIDHTSGRVPDLFDIDAGTVKRWTGEEIRKLVSVANG